MCAPVCASAAEWLAAALPDALVVKSFCNLSAYALHHSDPLTDPLKSVAASDDLGAAEAAAAFGRAMGVEVSWFFVRVRC